MPLAPAKRGKIRTFGAHRNGRAGGDVVEYARMCLSISPNSTLPLWQHFKAKQLQVCTQERALDLGKGGVVSGKGVVRQFELAH